MVITSSTYWNIGFGVNKGDIKQDNKGKSYIIKFAGVKLKWKIDKISYINYICRKLYLLNDNDRGGRLVEKGDKLFVRIDDRNNNKKFGTNDFEDHIDYLKKIAAERFFIGGGFENKKGGMIIFKAKNLKEAKRIAKNDPLIKRGLYSYKIYEWNLILLSEKIEDY